MSAWNDCAEANIMEADILEQSIADYDADILDELLLDRTTRKNIRWCTDNYASLGDGFAPSDEIMPSSITGIHGKVIQPRVSKGAEEQLRRTKGKAEVFTPSWVCNVQNNLVDEAWFKRKDIFNLSTSAGWKTNHKRIVFPEDKTWHDYIKDIRIEVSCGEAPYLVSRYDTVSGEYIPVKHRIGLLDRKLRVAYENTQDESGWLKWAKKAFQSSYGYDLQGDNLLLARENLLYSFVEYMAEYFGHEPELKDITCIARIVSWNIWQMDGITLTAPYSKQEREAVQIPLFGEEDESEQTVAIPCRIYDWSANRSIQFRSLLKNQGA